MADQLGGSAGGGEIGDPSVIYNQSQPIIALHQIMDWVNNVDPNMGQARGGATRPTSAIPDSYTRGPGGGGGLGSFQSAYLNPASSYVNRSPGRAGTGPQYVKLNDALADLHTLKPEQLTQKTQQLYAAGFYPDKSYAKGSPPPNGRVVTNEDTMAMMNLISTAQRYIKPDGTIIKTIDEILSESTAAGLGQEKLKSGAGSVQGQTYTVTTSDPATLRQQVTKVGQALLGRALNDSEQAALVDQMLAAERTPQEAAIQAGQTNDAGSDVRLATARVDAQARMEERIKSQNVNEATAYSEMNYVNVMREMIGGQ